MKSTSEPLRHLREPAWFSVEFDGRSSTVIAVSLFTVQVGLFLVGRAVDLILATDVAYGFVVTMLLFATLVFADARSVRFPLKQAALWAALVTFGMVFGAIPYARRRHLLRRSWPMKGA
ncbi:MAG TPA: hypothetical protein VM450_19580 [Thermomicrobiales bacterium]|nr:hypothetical protein [Thermomicrobiales bacterium]